MAIYVIPYRELGIKMDERVWAVKIDERGRTTIPKDLLKLLGIGTGEIMVFAREGNGPIYVGRAELKIEIPFTGKLERKTKAKTS
jgi:AbrB family looped-hinge helix DNA binding protein